jgi:hypothetical protein
MNSQYGAIHQVFIRAVQALQHLLFLRREIGRHLSDVADLRGQIAGHEVDVMTISSSSTIKIRSPIKPGSI